MKRADVIQRASDLEDVIVDAAGIISDDTITGLLQDYSVHVWALKYADDDYPLEQAIRIWDIIEFVESKLPDVPELIYEQYVVYLKLYSICTEALEKEGK